MSSLASTGAAVIGTGFIGTVHVEALRWIEDRRFEGTDDKVRQGFLIARDVLRPYCR